MLTPQLGFRRHFFLPKDPRRKEFSWEVQKNFQNKVEELKKEKEDTDSIADERDGYRI